MRGQRLSAIRWGVCVCVCGPAVEARGATRGGKHASGRQISSSHALKGFSTRMMGSDRQSDDGEDEARRMRGASRSERSSADHPTRRRPISPL
jgi:hypothetical protein